MREAVRGYEGSRKDAKTQRKPEPTVLAWSVDARTGGLRGRYLERGVLNDCSWMVAVVSE